MQITLKWLKTILQFIGNLTFSRDFISCTRRLIVVWNECDFVCVWLNCVSLGAFVWWDRWRIRRCECDSWSVCRSFVCNIKSFLCWKLLVLVIVGVGFLPGVLCLEISANVDASWLPEVTFNLECSVSCRHEFRIMLHNNHVWEDVTILKCLALTEWKFHCERSRTSAFHVARCFVLVETSPRVHYPCEVFLRQQLNLHRVGAAFELNFLETFSRCIDVKRIRNVLFPHICRWLIKDLSYYKVERLNVMETSRKQIMWIR